jgi:hypothetical protein
MLHAQQICQQHADGIYYIEDMLYQQFRQAIGRSVTPADFTAYMKVPPSSSILLPLPVAVRLPRPRLGFVHEPYFKPLGTNQTCGSWETNLLRGTQAPFLWCF